jgi:hypothetical protein
MHAQHTRTWHSGSSAPLNRNITGTSGRRSGGDATRLYASSSITPMLLASSPAPAEDVRMVCA